MFHSTQKRQVVLVAIPLVLGILLTSHTLAATTLARKGVRRLSFQSSSTTPQLVAASASALNALQSSSAPRRVRALRSHNFQQLSQGVQAQSNSGNAAVRNLGQLGTVHALGSNNIRRLSGALQAHSNSGNAAVRNLGQLGTVHALGSNSHRRLAEILQANSGSAPETETRSGHNIGLFDDIRDRMQEQQEAFEDAMEHLRDIAEGEAAIGEGGDDGMVPRDDEPAGGADPAIPADGDEPAIGEGGGDGMVPRDDEPAIGDGGGDGMVPRDDEPAIGDGGDDGMVPRDEDPAGDGGEDEVAPGGAVDEVFDGIRDVLDSLGHGAAGYGYSGCYYYPGIAVPGPVYLPVEAAVAANPLPVQAKTIVLVNPEATQQRINFVLAGEPLGLDPEQLLERSVVAPIVIRFDRGGGFGLAEYSLTEGVYEFKLTEHGWELFRRSFAVTLDNAANAGAFRYVVDGQAAVLAAGASQTHRGLFPIVIAFDRGNGQEPARAMLPNGIYRIAQSGETGLWELVAIGEAETM